MTTTTAQPRKTMADYVAQYGSSNVKALTEKAPEQVDFDTRLSLVSTWMDAVIAHRHGDDVAEAAREAEAAVEAAELLEPELPLFKPHPVLKAAGDMIRVRGWHQGDYRSDTTGAVCAMGAVHDVVYGADAHYRLSSIGVASPREVEAIDELMNRIAAETGDTYSVPGWNDSRTHVDQVLKLLY